MSYLHSATPQHPLHNTPEGVLFRFRCVAPSSPAPLPMLLLFCRDFDFLFSVWACAGEGRVSPLMEKLAEFKCGLGFAKLFSGDFDLAKPRLNFPRGGGVWGGIRAGFLNFLPK